MVEHRQRQDEHRLSECQFLAGQQVLVDPQRIGVEAVDGKKLTFRKPMLILTLPVFYHPLPSSGSAKPALPMPQKADAGLSALKALIR